MLTRSGHRHIRCCRMQTVPHPSSADLLLLIGRVLLGWLFSLPALRASSITGRLCRYLTNLKCQCEFWSWTVRRVEFLIGLALILGLATRYASLLCLLFLISRPARAPHWSIGCASDRPYSISSEHRDLRRSAAPVS